MWAVTTPGCAGAAGVACGGANTLSDNAFASGEIGTQDRSSGKVMFSPECQPPTQRRTTWMLLCWPTGLRIHHGYRIYLYRLPSDNITVTYPMWALQGHRTWHASCFRQYFNSSRAHFTVTGGIAPFTYITGYVEHGTGQRYPHQLPARHNIRQLHQWRSGWWQHRFRDNSNCTQAAIIGASRRRCTGNNNNYHITRVTGQTLTGFIAQRVQRIPQQLRVRDANEPGYQACWHAQSADCSCAGACIPDCELFGGNNGSITVTPSGWCRSLRLLGDGEPYPVLDAANQYVFWPYCGEAITFVYVTRITAASTITPIISVTARTAAVTANNNAHKCLCFGASTARRLRLQRSRAVRLFNW